MTKRDELLALAERLILMAPEADDMPRTRALMHEAASALRLSAEQREPVVRVKELEWSLAVGRTARWEAWSIFGTQIIIFDDLADAETSYGLFHHGLWLWHRSLAEAKSAAQADYEQRIMAAIETVARSSTVEPTAHNSLDAGSSPAAPTTSDGGSPGPSPLAVKPGSSDPASGRSQPSPDVSVDELARWLHANAFVIVDAVMSPAKYASMNPLARALLARFRIERLDRLEGGRK